MLKLSSRNSVDLSQNRSKAEKRKNVRFEEVDIYSSPSSSSSTAEFLRREGGNWNHLAEAFDCEEKPDEKGLMEELLNLCSWWGGSENIPHDSYSDSEDEDDDWLSLGQFANMQKHQLESMMKAANSSNWASNSPSVSCLRLNSVLRLDSKPVLTAKRSVTNTMDSGVPSSHFSISPPQPSCENLLSDKDRLENAFKGIVSEDNGVSQDNMKSSSREENTFWGDVEF